MHRSLLASAVILLSLLYSNAVTAQSIGPKQQVAQMESEDSVDRSESARKLYQEGMKLLDADQISAAAENFRQALQFDPEYADAYSGLARTYFKLRQWQKAVDNFNRAAVLNNKKRDTTKAAPDNTTRQASNVAPLPRENAASTKTSAKANPEVTRLGANPHSNKRDATPTNNGNYNQDAARLKQQSSGATVPLRNNSVKEQIRPVQPYSTSIGQTSLSKNSSTQITPQAGPNKEVTAAKADVRRGRPQRSLPLTFTTRQSSQLNSVLQPLLSLPLAKAPAVQLDNEPPALNSNASHDFEDLTAAQTETVANGGPAAGKPDETPVPEPTALPGGFVPVKAAPGVEVEITPNVPRPPARPEETSPTKIYRVGPNDVLDVRLNEAAGQQSTLYTITPAGLLEHPLLSEPLPVAGLTVGEIGSRIEDDLRRRAIVEAPKALVGVRDYASHTVLVSGLVKDAGTKFLRREAIPLYVVVADAQPLPEAAKVTVVRGELNEIHEIDLNQPAEMNFLVRSGDVITLRPNATQFVYIGGEVKLPGEKMFRRGLTLMQLVLASGGLAPRAKIAAIARNNDEGFLVTTRFKLKEIVRGKVADPLLIPGDRISILR